MVNILVKIDENANRVLNVVKAKYALNDKGQAIEYLVERYIEEEQEPELRPEFIEELRKAEKEKGIRVKDLNDLFK